MTVACISVAGYRSLHDLAFEAGPLTVITGGNGVGKTNVYRALERDEDGATQVKGQGLLEKPVWP